MFGKCVLDFTKGENNMKKCVLFILAFCVLASSSFFGKSILNVMAGEKEIEPRYYKSLSLIHI